MDSAYHYRLYMNDDFIQKAELELDELRRRAKLLEELIQKWTSTAPDRAQKSINSGASNPAPSSFVFPKTNGHEGNDVKIPGWIRRAIEMIEGEFNNPTVLLKIKSIAPPAMAESINNGRVSTELYRLAKLGQIKVTREVPGGAKFYIKTESFSREIVRRQRFFKAP